MGRVRLIGISEEAHQFDSAEDTFIFGRNFAERLTPNTILALYGDLGTGKTTFVQGIASHLGIAGPILSPTFVTLNLYEGSLPLFHFDLYRLKNGSDFFQMGFEEYFEREGVCAIEWPDKIAAELPERTLSLFFSHSGENRRIIRISAKRPNSEDAPCSY